MICGKTYLIHWYSLSHRVWQIQEYSLSSLVCTATLQSVFTARWCVCDIRVSVCLLEHTRRIPAQSTNSVPEVELSTCVRQKNSWVLWWRRLFFLYNLQVSSICIYQSFKYLVLIKKIRLFVKGQMMSKDRLRTGQVLIRERLVVVEMEVLKTQLSVAVLKYKCPQRTNIQTIGLLVHLVCYRDLVMLAIFSSVLFYVS